MDFRKVEARRISREREAARMHSTDACEEPESVWNQMAPLIDEALASLSAKDRNAIFLRFFENQSFRDIGQRLGGNENSARPPGRARAGETARIFSKTRRFVVERCALRCAARSIFSGSATGVGSFGDRALSLRVIALRLSRRSFGQFFGGPGGKDGPCRLAASWRSFFSLWFLPAWSAMIQLGLPLKSERQR
jgi:hypothetical protein